MRGIFGNLAATLFLLFKDGCYAGPLGYNCIKQRKLRGTQRGTYFTHEDRLATQIDKQLMIYGYQECVDVIGDVVSFNLILADKIK